MNRILVQNNMQRLVVPAILFALSFFFANGCSRDPDTRMKKLAVVYLLCPTGTQGCYNNCQTANDTNHDGVITGGEFVNFNTCTATCDTNCSLSFLYMSR